MLTIFTLNFLWGQNSCSHTVYNTQSTHTVPYCVLQWPFHSEISSSETEIQVAYSENKTLFLSNCVQ